ncbi:tetratricopeptide repeat protein [Geobacter sp. DSM 9736]|uniref:tetratricopeptide repeat protein n=1 Tax=Geobacter sp. DSM 9736 TaxID=1277350 RepID=UPI000B511B5F|nr:tetratricopeptide repeat protein [Geobacter sp. DSM 9736]SNB44906.1 Tetratricopeptide repeat-containing protein [Geobacter sp. DSM 9736]
MKNRKNKAGVSPAGPAEVPAPASVSDASLMEDPFIHLLLLICLCFASYWNSMAVPFTFDDFPYLCENPLIRSLSFFSGSLPPDSAFTNIDLKYNFILRPVAYFTFTLNYLAGGMQPGSYHLVNLLIHLGSTLLVYLLVRSLLILARQTGKDEKSLSFISFFTAAIFAVHPVQTQAVTYIVQRFTSLAAFLYLLTIFLYLRYRSSGSSALRAVYFLAALASAVCAMKTKEIAFTLPFVLLMVEFLFLEGSRRKRILGLLPFLLTMLIIPLNVAELSAQSSQSGSVLMNGTNLVNFKNVSPADYAITQLRVLMTYLRLLIFPVNLNIDYDYPLYTSLFDRIILLSLAGNLLLFGGGIWLLKLSYGETVHRLHLRIAAFGILWYFTALSVESSIIPLDDLIFEHRLYLPSVGFLLSAVTGADLLRQSLPRRTPAVAGAICLILIVFSMATIRRNSDWKNIWQDAVEKSPNKARPWNNLGDALMKGGNPVQAITSFKKALDLQPDYADAWMNLGTAYIDAGEYDKALEVLHSVLRKNPLDFHALNSVGVAYANQGEIEKAVGFFEKSNAVNPAYDTARTNLERARRELGLGGYSPPIPEIGVRSLE